MPLTEDEELELIEIELEQRRRAKAKTAPTPKPEVGVSQALAPSTTTALSKTYEPSPYTGLAKAPDVPSQPVPKPAQAQPTMGDLRLAESSEGFFQEKDGVIKYPAVDSPASQKAREATVGAIDDVSSLTTRAAGSAASQLGITSATGGEDKSFLEGMADPKASYMRKPKELLANVMAENFKDLKSKDRALVEKVGDAFMVALAGAGYLGSSVVESPEGTVAPLLRAAPLAAKAVSSPVKTSLAKLAGKPSEALERAAATPLKNIESAAGTERQIAEDLIKGKDLASESISEKTGLSKQAREIEASTTLRVPVEPSKGAVQGKLPAYSLDETGQLVKAPASAEYPISLFKNKLKDKKWEQKAQKTLDAVQDQFNFFQSKLAGKKSVTAKEMRDITKQWQKASKYNDVDDTEYNDFMKALAASGRMALEDAVVRSGQGKEYITLMRDIAKKSDALDEIGKKILGRDPREFAAKAEREISGIGFKKNVDDLERLKKLDAIIEEATGVKSDLADRAMNAFTAKQLGVEPGKSVPWVNDVGNGRSVLGAVLGGAIGSIAGLPSGGAGVILGTMATSPKAATLVYKSLNWAEAMGKSSKIRSIVKAMAETSSAEALVKLNAQLEKEMAALLKEDAGDSTATSAAKPSKK